MDWVEKKKENGVERIIGFILAIIVVAVMFCAVMKWSEVRPENVPVYRDAQAGYQEIMD